MSKIKDKLKPGSNRSFLARDFESLRTDLIEQAKIFFPDKIKDFSEPSVGGFLVDLAASVGDTMSFYLDHQFRELDPNSSVEIENIVTHLRNAGVKITGAAPSVVNVTMKIKVPVEIHPTTGISQPKESCLPVILENTTLKADNNVIFNLTEDLDFAKKNVLGDYEAKLNFVDFDSDSGQPLNVELTKDVIAISGKETLQRVSISDNHVPFREIVLSKPDVTEILYVKDGTGNPYYEVESLSQDTVFIPVDNTSRDDFDLVPKTLEVVPAPRRFVKKTSLVDKKTTIRFGSGNSEVLDDDIIPDPSELALNLYGKRTFSKFAIDPNSLLNTQTLGMSPRGTTIDILYRHGGGLSHNIDAGTLKTIESLNIEFRNSPSPAEALTARQSITCINPTQARGGDNAPGIEDLRPLVHSARNAQMRTVTRDDLLSRVYTLPASFGRVFRVGLSPNPTNPLSLVMHVISRDNNGNLSVSPDTLKINMSKYLNEFRLISDAIDIVDASIVNIGIRYEVYIDKDANKQITLQSINNRIADALQIKYFQIDQPLIIDDIVNIIINTQHVISLTDLRIYPITNDIDGRQYSTFSFPFEASTKNGIIRPPVGSIFELKFPQNDITGIAI